MSDWRHIASCSGLDGEMFFRDDTIGPGDKQATADAVRICVGCPVRSECLRWAIDNYADHGVFGGLTAAERRGLRIADRHRREAKETAQ